MFRRLAIFLCVVVCPISVFAQANGKLQIHYMDVGQGDGVVLISPFGEVVLIDDGVLNQCAKPIAYLQSLGITKIDYHIASHYHSDHIGCAPQILQQFPVQKAAFDRGGSYTTATFAGYVNAVGAKRQTAQKGQTITLDAGSLTPVTITFAALNGNGVSTSDENDLSLVAVVRFGQFDAEFGGDLSGTGTGSVDPDPGEPSPAPSPAPAPSPSPSCTYSITPTSHSATSSGGSFSVSVTTSAGCAWTASSNASWITSASGATGSGSGTAAFNIAANTSTARSATLTVAGQTASVSQAAGTSSSCAPATASCGAATARCNDGTLSCSQNRSGTCSSHGGVSCWICPGRLCSGLLAGEQSLLSTPVEGPGSHSYADIESGVATSVGQIEVYKVHHHGSAFSSSVAWLTTTAPKVGIVSVSSTNTYGHPTAAAMGRLRNASVKTYWTSAGRGASPVSGQDFVSTGTGIVVEVPPASSTFTVRYNGTTDTYSVWGAVTPTTPVAAPFGGFDTPSDSSTVTGAIAVTGWALDDIGVTKVDILRDAHPSDPAGAVSNGRVFVGSATFVTGGRGDIAAGYPSYPNANRAGWGYLMLTRGLIWDGHGPFNLYAVATDSQGNSTTVGSKRITINNAIATKPFGNIDTPDQGGTVSGTFVNFGWVVALGGRTIPAANVQVAIDGVILPQASECLTNRADITQGFPGFDTTQAIRCFVIDSTKYANGLHTIGWLVTDSAGQADGIGSRFFTIANPAITASTEETGKK